MNLTDRQFWLNYWENKEGLVFEVKENYVLSDVLKKIVDHHHPETAIELGGFPGYYAVYLQKHLGIKASLLDYVIHSEITNKLLSINHIKENDITLIETDLFTHQTPQQYDLVMSVGLIEHFEDTADIINLHLKYLKEGGSLFINIPNFRGVNGTIQRWFDIENYRKHHIACMDLAFLEKTCATLGLKQIEVKYYGGFMIWLENIKEKSRIFKILFKAFWLVFKVIFKIIPIETKTFSPYINIRAVK
jgi:SAM-dependent methyltransferase